MPMREENFEGVERVKHTHRPWEEENGQSMVENGLLFALLTLVCIMVLSSLGQEIATGLLGMLERLWGV